MKILFIILLAVLVGCSGRPTLEELEDEALVTGDWTEVEKRERSMKARNALYADQEVCPATHTRVCFESGMDIDCTCMKGSYAPTPDYQEIAR